MAQLQAALQARSAAEAALAESVSGLERSLAATAADLTGTRLALEAAEAARSGLQASLQARMRLPVTLAGCTAQWTLNVSARGLRPHASACV